MPPLIFLSYRFGEDDKLTSDHEFILRVGYWMRVQGLRPFMWGIDATEEPSWDVQLTKAIRKSAGVVIFCSGELGDTQRKELEEAFNERKPVIFVAMRGQDVGALRKDVGVLGPDGPNPATVVVRVSRPPVPDDEWFRRTAKDIVETLKRRGAMGVDWFCDDGLPIPGEVRNPANEKEVVFPFDYERRIIRSYLDGTIDVKTPVGRRLIQQGCPISWPSAPARQPGTLKNNLKTDEIGVLRDSEGERHVLSGALSRFTLDEIDRKKLYFAEAGPRGKLLYGADPGDLGVGILVAGGIAPGINAVIAGIVERHCLYANIVNPARLTVLGFKYGFDALYKPGIAYRHDLVQMQGGKAVPLADLAVHANEGGSFLGTSRLPDFAELGPEERGERLTNAVDRAVGLGLGILYVIGGDGSMKAAHALHNTARAMGKDLAVVGIPKTMDNDILWVWASFGFQSAVQQSTEAVRQLWTEASSNPRLCVIQLFGSDSGFVVTDAAAASGKCDLFLVPEQRFTMDAIASHLAGKLIAEQRAYAVVVMAETSVPLDVEKYVRDPEGPGISDADRELLRQIGLRQPEREALARYAGVPLGAGVPGQPGTVRRVVGPTPDALRSGALKIVSRVLHWKLKNHPSKGWTELRVMTNEPRHLIRAIPPSSSDIIFARRLAYLAVDGAMAGFRDFMISQWLTEYVMVPLPLVVLGRKRIPTDGAFYANARASTGQPSVLEPE